MTATTPAVRVRGLGKQYRIGAQKSSGAAYDAVARRLGRTDSSRSHEPAPTIWALRDIDMEVPHGQAVGVLGRNGSGKSTLMKILARVTAPTAGTAEVQGRVGALLQVGAGFHPELSGRDNIALSGAILGMSRHEIEAAEPAIVEFAEIGQFLDTSVKHYSSGMYMRLAFSVSAHLSAEVMLVDEVLQVGDASFQQKCQRRIKELVSTGRTVLFVSHNLRSVLDLCDSSVVLDGGRLRFAGDTAEAVRFYEEEVMALTRQD
jgi:lipopolysaccharide transport system ATP-binding protein